MKKTLIITLLLFSGLFLTSCNNDGKSDSPELSINGQTGNIDLKFSLTGMERTVKVKSSTAWKATYPNWITVSPKTGKKGQTDITISVGDISEEEITEREGTIRFSNEDDRIVTITVIQKDGNFGKYIFEQHFVLGVSALSVSENGKYIAGNSSEYYFSLDITTPGATPVTGLIEEGVIDHIRGVDNEGHVYPRGVTPDGSLTVNAREEQIRDNNGELIVNFITPTINTYGEVKDLPYLEKDMLGNDKYSMYRGNYTNAISDDGRVIAGWMAPSHGDWTACLWIKNAQGVYEHKLIGEEYYEFVTVNGIEFNDAGLFPNTSSGISRNGKYLCCDYYGKDNDYQYTPTLYDIENDEFTILSDITDGLSFAVLDDGTFFYGTPNYSYERTSYVRNPDGTIEGLNSWIERNYNEDGLLNMPFKANTGGPIGMVSDGTFVWSDFVVTDEYSGWMNYVIRPNPEY